jgi:hypothetical protein
MQQLIFEKSPLSLEDYSRINRRVILKTRWWYLCLLFLMIIIISGNNFLTNLSSHENRFEASDLIILLLPFAIITGSMYFSYKRLFKKNYMNTPALAEGAIYTLSDSTISMISESTNVSQPWPISFKKALLIDHWIVLYASATTAYFLDLNTLVSPAALSDVKILLQQKGILLKE